jgi:hypothetical protein
MRWLSVFGETSREIGSALRRTVNDHALAVEQDLFSARTGYHRLLRALYDNTLYEDAAAWQAYKARFRLPRAIRAIYNPTRRAVDWYPGHVYPGPWTRDGRPLPDGTPPALPFSPDVLADRPALVAAALQALSWGNWASERHVYVREGAKLGSVLVVVTDNLERRKVYPEVVPLERVRDLVLDASGNVKGYAIEYQTVDPATRRVVTYRREVNRERILERFGNQTVTEIANPYGFVPAVWVRHRHVGGLFGAPVIDGVIAKIDELNALVTAVHNYIHRWHNQPMIFFGTQSQPRPAAKGSESDDELVTTEIERVRWLWDPSPSGKVEPLMREMGIGQAGTYLTQLLEEIEADLPEIVMDEQLRGMSQVTGPGAAQMMSDVAAKLWEAQANYDAGLIKLMQMSVAIGGWRLARGDWGPRSQITPQQQAFAGFDLTSYARNELELELMPRPLVPATPSERLSQWALEKDVLGLSDAEMRRRAGIGPELSAQIDQELIREGERQTAAGAFA